MSGHCIGMGCRNEVVRVLSHKDAPRVIIRLCAFHVRRAILYMTDEQVRRLVFPKPEEPEK